MQSVKKSLEEQQHKTDDVWKRVTQKQQTVKQTVADCRRSQVDSSEGRRRTKKHELEVEIEKVVKAWKEAQSAAEIADREEQIAHNKEGRTTSSTRRTRRNPSRKWKLNWTDYRSRRPAIMDAQVVIQFEQVDFEQVAEKRQAASQTKNDTNLAKQSGVSKNTQHNVK